VQLYVLVGITPAIIIELLFNEKFIPPDAVTPSILTIVILLRKDGDFSIFIFTKFKLLLISCSQLDVSVNVIFVFVIEL
jgi:hypothetical protein